MMSTLLNYLWTTEKYDYDINTEDITVSVAESVTAGALSNSLCSEPGASKMFTGGIVAYSINSKKDILGVDVKYAELNNFANPFTTCEMAKAVVKKLKSRIGIATTGYSLPYKRDATSIECGLDIKIPYACICLYDSIRDIDQTITVYYTDYDPNGNQKIQKASAQAKFALVAHNMFNEYVQGILKK
jgi:hypothetical protein